MSRSPVMRPAMPDEAECLSDLALRSKAYWGYSTEFMASCRAELTVNPEQIKSGRSEYVVAMDDGAIVGFYALEAVSRTKFEMEALFVEPDCIGCGIGRQLMQHAVRSLADRGGEILVIQGDPNATEFYLAAGAQPIGSRESESIPGRLLPLFKIDLHR